MATIDPTVESFKALFANVPADTPVTMLNLLRFRDRANYAAGSGQSPCSGAEAYARYTGLVLPLLGKVGARIVWRGAARSSVIAPAGERWDEVLLVEYPSSAAFAAMVKSAEYQAVVFHRTAALLDSRLIATTAGA